MPSVKSALFVVLLSGAALSALSAGCKSSTTNDVTIRKSTKGEVCQTTNDCADGLDCVPRASEPGGLCVNGEFKVSPTSKECAVIECANPIDCCPAVPQGIDCPTLNSECQQFGPTSSYCTEYKQYCACDGTKYACTNGSCLSICQTATDCGGGNFQCNGGHCVECSTDAQCTNGLVCSDAGACVAPCKSDTDCSAFNRCANGHCSATGGCQTDRECIASTKNVTATCASGTCVVPCQSDLECGNPEEYTFYSCIQNQCIYVGCQTDKECQLYMGGGVQPGGKHQQIVCRDKAAK